MSIAAIVLAVLSAVAPDLSLRGPDGQTQALSRTEVAALPHVKLTNKQHDQVHVYEGVPVTLLLARVGTPTGAALKGRELGDFVGVTASDGYQVTLGLAETDPAVRPEQVILADRADGAPLPAEAPFRLVIEGDLKPARSARGVVAIEVFRIPPPALN